MARLFSGWFYDLLSTYSRLYSRPPPSALEEVADLCHCRWYCDDKQEQPRSQEYNRIVIPNGCDLTVSLFGTTESLRLQMKNPFRDPSLAGCSFLLLGGIQPPHLPICSTLLYSTYIIYLSVANSESVSTRFVPICISANHLHCDIWLPDDSPRASWAVQICWIAHCLSTAQMHLTRLGHVVGL